MIGMSKMPQSLDAVAPFNELNELRKVLGCLCSRRIHHPHDHSADFNEEWLTPNTSSTSIKKAIPSPGE